MYIPAGGVALQPGSTPAHGLCDGVVCDRAVLRDISAHAVEGLVKLRHGGLEVGGVLYGQIEREGVRIATSRPFMPAYAFGPVYRLSERDLDALRELIAAPQSDADLGGMHTVGWYVSHTRSDLALTENNLQTFSQCFPLSGQVALVLKPAKFDPSRAVLYRRDAQMTLTASPEFLIHHDEVPAGGAGVEDNRHPEGALVRAHNPLLEVPKPEAPIRVELEAPAASPITPHPPGRLRSTVRMAAASAFLCAIAVATFEIASILWPAKSTTKMSVAAAAPPLVILPERPAVASASATITAVSTPQDADRAPQPAVPKIHEDPASRLKALEREVAELRSRLKSPEPLKAEPSKSPDSAPAQRQPRTFVPPPPRGAPASATAVPSLSPELPPAIVVPQTLLPALPVVSTAAPPPPSRTKATGRLIWTGSLRKGALLFIEDSRPSSGALTGKLPGGPVHFTIHTGELTDGGLRIYSANSRLAGRSESPRAANGWNHTIYEYDPKRLKDIEIMEVPRSDNAWKKVVLRAINRPVGMIIVDWESGGEAQQRP